MDNNNSETLSDIRVMLLGDSITQANTEHDSYRRPLWQKLNEAGFNNIDFVGSLQENQGGSNPNPDFDLDHEGHWGWRTDEILNQLDGWVASAQPDVAFIHLGTNDILQGQSADSTIDELGEVIDVFRANNPNIVIFLAQIIPARRNDDEREKLNQQISILAAEKSQVDSPIVVVDQSSGFNLRDDTYDSVHPNSRGENKFADQWLASFDEIFGSTSSTTTASDSLDSEGTATDENAQMGSTVFRFVDPISGVPLYTADPLEYESLLNEPTNYNFEGASHISVDPLTGGEEVFRFRNQDTGTYFYTISPTEKDFVRDNIDRYVFEDSQFNAYQTEVEGTIPIYRFYNPTLGTHYFTENIDERVFVDNNPSYDFEGIAYYAYPV
ncbi:GDSL-type esterase/lipase family protein [Pleurocapsa sp. PCC 7319]|uniref:GDSL-type esterase/lipase family protein n=1 Tax=Pleurocapsa sp. PCC 7319 TaxID=118161 RepID=UPI00034C9A18|nr:GDSL-type esterase/lipase family protein [Pleurocapsa sp. PCC 7319]